MWEVRLTAWTTKGENMAEAKKELQKSKKDGLKTQEKPEDDTSQNESIKAKAGKRSAKALAESEEKRLKEEKELSKTDEVAKPKVSTKATRSRAERRSKKYKTSAKLIEVKAYSVKEAIDLVKKTSSTKFDASVEVHIRLNVDPKQADQNIRDNVVLPAGTGKTIVVAAFVDDEKIDDAKKVGADIVGLEEITKKLDKSIVDFDVLVAPPNLMVKLAKYARILGPRGLMPNPKSGTVTNDIVGAISQSKAGRIEYRVDSSGIIHVAVGKISFSIDQLQQNITTLFESVKQNKPASVRGIFVKTIFVTSTMGPSIKIKSDEL